MDEDQKNIAFKLCFLFYRIRGELLSGEKLLESAQLCKIGIILIIGTFFHHQDRSDSVLFEGSEISGLEEVFDRLGLR